MPHSALLGTACADRCESSVHLGLRGRSDRRTAAVPRGEPTAKFLPRRTIPMFLDADATSHGPSGAATVMIEKAVDVMLAVDLVAWRNATNSTQLTYFPQTVTSRRLSTRTRTRQEDLCCVGASRSPTRFSGEFVSSALSATGLRTATSSPHAGCQLILHESKPRRTETGQHPAGRDRGRRARIHPQARTAGLGKHGAGKGDLVATTPGVLQRACKWYSSSPRTWEGAAMSRIASGTGDDRQRDAGGGVQRGAAGPPPHPHRSS